MECFPYNRLSIYGDWIYGNIKHNVKRRRTTICWDYELRKDFPYLAYWRAVGCIFFVLGRKGAWDMKSACGMAAVLAIMKVIVTVASFFEGFAIQWRQWIKPNHSDRSRKGFHNMETNPIIMIEELHGRAIHVWFDLYIVTDETHSWRACLRVNAIINITWPHYVNVPLWSHFEKIIKISTVYTFYYFWRYFLIVIYSFCVSRILLVQTCTLTDQFGIILQELKCCVAPFGKSLYKATL